VIYFTVILRQLIPTLDYFLHQYIMTVHLLCLQIIILNVLNSSARPDTSDQRSRSRVHPGWEYHG
jgi:hypothetical protein